MEFEMFDMVTMEEFFEFTGQSKITGDIHGHYSLFFDGDKLVAYCDISKRPVEKKFFVLRQTN